MSKKEKKRATEGGPDLFSFFGGESISARSEGSYVNKRSTSSSQRAVNLTILEDEIRLFLKNKSGKVKKSELYSWAKEKDLPPATLYMLINRMINEGKLRKSFDESSNELTYELM